MPDSFQLVIDLTGPQNVAAEINGGNESTTSVDVLLAVETSDDPSAGYEVKVWGGIDITYLGNGSYAETEGGADWIPLTSPLSVRLNPAGGLKTLNVRVRDDVHNESVVASDQITLIGVEPEVPPAPEPTPEPGGMPEPDRTQPEVKATETRVEVEFDYRVRVVTSIPTWHVGISASTIESAVAVSVHAALAEETAVLARPGRISSTSTIEEAAAVEKTPVGPQLQETLIALEVL